MHRDYITTESAGRRQLLEEQLFQAMLQKPYAEISVSELCEDAGVSRKSFYRYFGNKDGCLNALLDRVFLGSGNHSGTIDFSGGMNSPALLEVMDYWIGQKPLLDAIVANGLQSHLLERCLEYMIHEERNSLLWLGITDVDQDPEKALFSLTGFFSVLLHWCQTSFPRSTSEMAQIMSHLWTQPLMQQPE